MVFLNILILWSNTIINIPVHDNLDNYKELPIANLYIDGEIVIDEQMYYQYEVDRTFFSVINTSNLGSYQVKYRVYFPSFDKVHTQTIFFNVVDDIPPEIIYMPSFNIPVGSRNIDLTNGIKVADNYDDENDLTIRIVNMHQINLNQVGLQTIVYEVKDLSNNIMQYTHEINVYDNIAPVIKQNHIVEIILGEKINYRSFFSVTDNYDDVLFVQFDDSLINYHQIGNYPAKITASDQSGNKSTYNFKILVKDVFPPTIKLRQKSINLPLQFNLTNDYLLSLVLSVEDNHDDLTIDNIIIKNLVVNNIVNTYDVIYTCYDVSGNKVEEILKVNIIDDEPPNLIIVNELIIEVGSLYIDFNKFIKVSDNWDSNPTYKITSNYTLDKIGSYLLTIEVTDSSRNSKTYYEILEVVDTSPPIIKLMDKLIQISHIDELKDYVVVEDNYDSYNLVIVEFDFFSNNNFKPGKYEAEVIAIDSSNNKSTQIIHFEIIDKIPPEIILRTTKIELSYLDTTIDYAKIDFNVVDNYTKTSEIKVSFENNIKFGVVGIYQVFLIATDQALNETVLIIPVFIKDLNPPYITNTDEFIYKMPIKLDNIIKDIKLNDDYSNDLMIDYPKNLLINKPGNYQIPIIITDEYGNSDEIYLEVKLLKQPFYQNKIIILSSIVLIVLISSLIIIYYKKRDETSFDNF